MSGGSALHYVSESCWDDICDECQDPDCECLCHGEDGEYGD